jgi:hypothetical protein
VGIPDGDPECRHHSASKLKEQQIESYLPFTYHAHECWSVVIKGRLAYIPAVDPSIIRTHLGEGKMLETTEINEINNAYYREGHKNIMYLRRRTKRFNRTDHTCHKEDNSFIIYSGGRIIRVSRKDHKLIICIRKKGICHSGIYSHKCHYDSHDSYD